MQLRAAALQVSVRAHRNVIYFKIHVWMAGSCATAPSNRSHFALIVAPLSAFQIYGYVAASHEKANGHRKTSRLSPDPVPGSPER